MRAREHDEKGPWFGLGAFGLIGWSVAVPTLLGLALGLWMDRVRETSISFTLMFLVAGVALGAANAWFWMNREQRIIEREKEAEREEDDE
jgi:ATP synthase protein I